MSGATYSLAAVERIARLYLDDRALQGFLGALAANGEGPKRDMRREGLTTYREVGPDGETVATIRVIASSPYDSEPGGVSADVGEIVNWFAGLAPSEEITCITEEHIKTGNGPVYDISGLAQVVMGGTMCYALVIGEL